MLKHWGPKLGRAVVAHHFWGRPGGGQLVCASAAYALERAGFKPVLVSTTRFDAGKYIDWFGIDIEGYDTLTMFNSELRVFGLYLRLLTFIPLKKAIEKFSPRVVFIDESTYGPVEEFVRERTELIEYIHFPFEVLVDSRFRGSGFYYGEDPYILERYGKFPMNVYWWVYIRLLPRFMRKNPFDIASAVLTNSRWTAELAERVYGERPQILNPPISPSTKLVEEPRGFDSRENSVVMVGRFSEEKRYHWVVEKVVPKLVREVGSVKLYIFGGARAKTSLSYVSRVERIAKNVGLRVSRSLGASADVYLIVDSPRETINEVLDSSKVFLHATVNEHWGIAVAEAMARGVPVVIHRSGGAWSDIASEGIYCLGYDNEDGAVESLANLLVNERLWRSYSRRSIERVRELTLEKFVEKFLIIVKRLI